MRVVNIRKEPCTYYIGRGSPLGNPATHLPLSRTKALVQVDSLEEALAWYEAYAREKIKNDPDFRKVIEDLDENEVLGCYCKPKGCHGDIIMKLWQELRDIHTVLSV